MERRRREFMLTYYSDKNTIDKINNHTEGFYMFSGTEFELLIKAKSFGYLKVVGFSLSSSSFSSSLFLLLCFALFCFVLFCFVLFCFVLF